MAKLDVTMVNEAGTTAIIPLADRRMHEKSRDGLAALRDVSNRSEPRIFQQAGALVRLRFLDGRPVIEGLSVDALRGELDRAACWMNRRGDFIDPPLAVVRDVLAMPDYDGIPRLRAVVEAPFVTREGRIIRTAGYHPDIAVYYLADDFDLGDVPTTPTAKDVAHARDLIVEDLLVDFPFDDEASRAHAVALVITPFLRELIDAPTPLIGVDAPMPGTGKGLLVNAAALIATGRPIETMTEAANEDELRKRITAVLLAAGPFGLFDNVARRLASGVLSALLTARLWKDRLLGVSRMVGLANVTQWIATGNNLGFSREVARRTVWIRLDAKDPRPHRRRRFKHDPLEAWIGSARGELVRAMLVLAQHWINEGSPRFTARRLGSYESWAQVVGGVLGTANIEGFLGNLDTFAAVADEESMKWDQFIREWWQKHNDAPADVATLLPLALDPLADRLGDGNDRSQRTRLGKALATRRDYTFDADVVTVKLVSTKPIRDNEGRERAAWKLVKVGTLGADRDPANESADFERPQRSPQRAADIANVGGYAVEGKHQLDLTLTGASPKVPTSQRHRRLHLDDEGDV